MTITAFLISVAVAIAIGASINLYRRNRDADR